MFLRDERKTKVAAAGAGFRGPVPPCCVPGPQTQTPGGAKLRGRDTAGREGDRTQSQGWGGLTRKGLDIAAKQAEGRGEGSGSDSGTGWAGRVPL